MLIAFHCLRDQDRKSQSNIPAGYLTSLCTRTPEEPRTAKLFRNPRFPTLEDSLPSFTENSRFPTLSQFDSRWGHRKQKEHCCSFCFLCPQRESNLHLLLRTELFYPLNYRGNNEPVGARFGYTTTYSGIFKSPASLGLLKPTMTSPSTSITGTPIWPDFLTISSRFARSVPTSNSWKAILCFVKYSFANLQYTQYCVEYTVTDFMIEQLTVNGCILA